MDYEKIIHSLVDSFIEHKDSLLVREMPSEDEHDLTLLIASEPDDTARLIGKRGCVANSLRELLSIAGKQENKRIHLKFESFGEEKDGE